MTLQVYTLALGNFRDDTSGNNYAANTPVYILNSGGTLADIFRDQAGAQPIVQDGLNNISDAYGEFTFYVNSGQYISRVAGRDRLINVVGSDYFDSRVDDAVEQITQQTLASRGFRVVGTFADGFTYELFNDVGIDADGNSWIYVGAGAPNKVVSAGTVPSAGAGYEQVTFNALQQLNGLDEPSGLDRAYNRSVSISDIVSGTYNMVGSTVKIKERRNSEYNIFYGYPQVANGFDVIDAGNGYSAVYTGWQGECDLLSIGLEVNTSTDQHDVIQRALDVYKNVKFPEGVIDTSPLSVPSNRHLKFNIGTKINATSGYDWFHCIFNLDNVSNVIMDFNMAEVRMLRSEYPLQEVINGNLINSEYRHCIKIYGSRSVTINHPRCFDAGGDGVTVGGNDPCYNIVLNDVRTDNCRRQGISVTNGAGIWVNSPKFYNTNGLAPESGIDIEPNPVPNYINQGIYVNDVYSQNNSGGAVLIAMGLEAGYKTPVSVFVNGVTSISDGKNGGGALRCVGGIESTAKVGGRITVRDFVATTPKSSGVYIGRWNDNSPHLVLENISINNPGSDPKTSSPLHSSGIVYRAEQDETVGNFYGNFEIKGYELWDDKNIAGKARTYAPVYINNANTSNEIMRDISISGFSYYRSASDWGNGSKSPLIISTTEMEDCVFDFNKTKIPTAGSTTTSLGWLGSIMSVTTSSTITLRPATQVKGSTYKISVDESVTVQIQTSGTDKIAGYSSFTGLRATEKGAYLEFTASDSGDGWVISGGITHMWTAY